MSNIIPFNFEDHAVRVVTRDGEPWFVLADVCGVLEIGNPSDAARRLDADEKHALDIIDPMGRTQTATIINESGLYSLILTSRKPSAKRFKKWITSEVIPSIRKTGGYMVAARGLDVDEKNTITLSNGIRGNPNMTIINESGLYSIILKSLIEARRGHRSGFMVYYTRQ